MSVLDPPTLVLAVRVGALLVGFGIAAFFDLRVREVSDTLWQALAVVGILVGVLEALPSGAFEVVLWSVVALFAAQHLVPWDEVVERHSAILPGILEAVLYIAVGTLVVLVGVTDGVGPTGLPVPVIGLFATVLLARGLFEARVLYGGADAKALMVAGLLLPATSQTLLALPASASAILRVYPFPLTLLMNAALAAVVVPIAIALRNLSSGDFEFPRGFVGYRIPVGQLDRRFVWLKEPTVDALKEEEEAVETSEDDRRLREHQKAELLRRGIRKVWVTPQLPFLVLLAAGAALALLAGNLVFDLLAVL